MSVVDRLNDKQQEAAQFGSGPLLIIAGAGTGKTNTLAHRVAHLVLSGAKADRILLLTFTRRAAQEMIRRTQRIVGKRTCGRTPAQGSDPVTAAVVRHLSLDREPPDPAARGGGGPGRQLQRARSRRCRRPDGRSAARAGIFEIGEALSAKGHVPRHLLAPRQHAAAAVRNARRAVPVVR